MESTEASFISMWLLRLIKLSNYGDTSSTIIVVLLRPYCIECFYKFWSDFYKSFYIMNKNPFFIYLRYLLLSAEGGFNNITIFLPWQETGYHKMLPPWFLFTVPRLLWTSGKEFFIFCWQVTCNERKLFAQSVQPTRFWQIAMSPILSQCCKCL